MPYTGTARAKIAPLTYWEAVKIINAMPYLVCSCNQKLLNSQLRPRYRDTTKRVLPEIYEVGFEVMAGSRSYKFPAQPFRVLRVITQRRVPKGRSVGYD